MFEDLIKDRIELKLKTPGNTQQIDMIISYAKECKDDVYSYLKFYGD